MGLLTMSRGSATWHLRSFVKPFQVLAYLNGHRKVQPEKDDASPLFHAAKARPTRPGWRFASGGICLSGALGGLRRDDPLGGLEMELGDLVEPF
jgi:hypothetical protein